MAPSLRSSHPLALLYACLLAGGLLAALAPAPAAPLDADYRLQPGDALTVAVLGEPDFGGLRSIGPGGTIPLPVIGALEVGGQTIAEVRAEIIRLLRDIMRDPYVTVALDEMQSKRRVYVSGQVKNLGSHVLPLGATVVEAIAAAGLLEDADLSQVQLTRGDGQITALDLGGLRSGKQLAADPDLRWDDRIFIPRLDAYVTIVGRVLKPGSYSLPADRSLRVLDLLTQVSGGIVEGAEHRMMLLVRDGQPEPERIDLRRLLNEGDLTQNYELRANDVLVLPEADRIAVAGEVVQPTAFYANGKMTVLEALAKAGGFTPLAGMRLATVTHPDGVAVGVDLEALWRRGELDKNIELEPGDVLMVPRADPEEVLVTGAVVKAGAYDLRDVQDRSLVRAITLQGPAPDADLTRVSLFRGDEHLVCNVRAALETGDQRSNPSLQPGDVVYVPLSDQVLVIGAFPRSGPQPYDAKLTLMDYIARAGGVVSGHLDKGVLLRPLPDGTSEMVRLDLSKMQTGVVPEPVVVKPGDIIYVPIKDPKRDIWDRISNFIVTLGATKSLFD